MSTAPFVGYPGKVWGACWQSLSWLGSLLSTTSSPTTLQAPVTAVFQTLWNGLAALSAWQTGATLSVEAQNFFTLESLPLSLDSVTAGYLANRAAACAVAAQDISSLPPVVSLYNVSAKLAAGQPVIPDPGFLEWCMQFDAEAAPIGTVLPQGAVDAANAWLAITGAVLSLQGSSLTPAYDTAARQYRCSSVIANILSSASSGPFSSLTQTSPPQPLTDDLGNVLTDDLGNVLYATSGTEGDYTWSTVVSLPVLLLDAAALNAPVTLLSQQISVIRYVLGAQLQQLSKLLLSFRSQNVTQPSTATLRNAESLMDLSARATGSFENWTKIVALNQLSPPWPGPTNPALALSGRQLFTAGQGIGPSAQPTYAANVLGTDYDFGPVNGPQPQWLGDIPLITGYLNFARAIGRRLQTPLGSLIYHPNYGCSIPPEIGAVQSENEAQRIAAYGRAAIQGDPRTGSILSATASVQPGFLANFTASITPIGPGAIAVNINEVIGAAP